MTQTTSFLPAIQNNGNNMAGITGMSGVRTGQSFQKSRNDFQIRTGRVSPIRSASITALLSPREMVREFTRQGSNDMGIQGYNMPKAGNPRKVINGMMNKNKSPGNIESEANYRRNFPGAGQYNVLEDVPWNERGGKGAARGNMEKAPRLMMADICAINASKPEKCTPSPHVYSVNKEKILPSLGKGGASLMQA